MITVDLQRSVKFNCFWAHFCKPHRKSPQPRSMIPVTGYGRILPETAFFPALSCRFPRTSGQNFIVPGNEKIRQVPFTGFYPKVRGIRAGNQPEINVSLRNLIGKVRIAAGSQLKNTVFRGTLIKSFSIFWVTERQTRKVFQRSQ